MANVQKWEYQVAQFSIDTADRESENLAKLGAEGWELVSVGLYEGVQWHAFFKRPKFDEPARIQPMKP